MVSVRGSGPLNRTRARGTKSRSEGRRRNGRPCISCPCPIYRGCSPTSSGRTRASAGMVPRKSNRRRLMGGGHSIKGRSPVTSMKGSAGATQVEIGRPTRKGRSYNQQSKIQPRTRRLILSSVSTELIRQSDGEATRTRVWTSSGSSVPPVFI